MCPHWAVEVFMSAEVPGKAAIREKITGLPRLASDPPFVNCSGCQHPTVGRIIAEVIDELGLDDKFVALDAISCGGSSVFNMEFGRVLDVYDDPIEIAIATKRAHPDKIVFTVQNSAKFDITGFDSFISALACGEGITIINCNDPVYGPWPVRWHIATPMNRIAAPEAQEVTMGKYPVPTAELAAQFKGVAYSARGAITSPDDYEYTKSCIRTAFQKQTNNVGLSFVEVLCACLVLSYEPPIDCLKWIKEKMATELPLGEFKNVDQVE
jgi:2-oxoglutarate ferredoxin oxidoreductase subunit beta